MAIDLDTAANMITTAVESPFGSWFEFREYRWGAKLPNGKIVDEELEINHTGAIHYAEVEARHLDGDTGEVKGDWVRVTPRKFRKGIEKWCENQGKTLNEIISDHDAIDADGAMQFCLLGEVIYG